MDIPYHLIVTQINICYSQGFKWEEKYSWLEIITELSHINIRLNSSKNDYKRLGQLIVKTIKIRII